jgi:hypothetical protein
MKNAAAIRSRVSGPVFGLVTSFGTTGFTGVCTTVGVGFTGVTTAGVTTGAFRV